MAMPLRWFLWASDGLVVRDPCPYLQLCFFGEREDEGLTGQTVLLPTTGFEVAVAELGLFG